MHSPSIRFPGYTEKWSTTKLGDVTKWSSGNTPSKQEPNFWGGDIPWISASSMRGEEYSDSDLHITQAGLAKSKLVKKGDLLLLVRGSMLFNRIPVGIAGRDMAFNQDVKSLSCQQSVLPEFLLNWFFAQEEKIIAMVTRTGIGAGKLEPADVQDLAFSFPGKDEQQKIVSLMGALSRKVRLLERKADLLASYKKSLAKSLFSQSLRLKNGGDNFPEWDVIELGALAIKVKTKNRDGAITDVLTNSATRGIINQSEYFEREIVNEDNIHGYYVVEKDDFVYNPRISSNAPVGPIKRNTIGPGVMSPLYTVFRFNSGHLDFFEQYFETDEWHDHMRSVANSGARHDRMNIANEDFFSLPIPLPTEGEMRKISALLSAIDAKIVFAQEQLEQLKDYKLSLLQDMLA